MEAHTKYPSKISTIIGDENRLKKLISKIKESLLSNKFSDDHSSDLIKTYDHKNEISLRKGKKYLHKLMRMDEELKFAKENRKNYEKLSIREKEIIKLLIKGLNNPEIAKHLFISRYTVEQHRKNLNRKLKIKSFVQIIRFAYAFDLD